MKKLVLYFLLMLYPIQFAIGQNDILNSKGIHSLGLSESKENLKLLKKLYKHYALKDPTKAHAYVIKALELAEHIKDKSEVQELYQQMGEIYRASGNYSLSIEYFFRSLALLKELKNTIGVIYTYNDIGNCYFELNDYAKALKYYRMGIAIGKLSPQYGLALAVSLNNEGLFFTQKENFMAALENHKKGLELRKKSADISLLIHSYKSIAIDYISLQKPDSAAYYLELASESCSKSADSIVLASIFEIKGELYALTREYSKSDSCFTRTKNIFEKEKAYSSLAKMYLHWSEVYLGKKDFVKAEILVNYAIDNAKIAKSDPLLSDAYSVYIKLLKETKQYDLAFSFYQKLAKMKDEILTRQMQQAFELAKSQDEIYKLDNQISMARMEQSKADEKIKAQSFRLWVLVVIILIVSIFAGFSLRFTIIQKRKNRELKMANIRVENALKAKSDFLSNMSHEIRTPMNGIVGFTDLLLSEKLRPKEKEFVQSIKFSANNLMVIINDILDYSKIEAGKLSLVKSDFDLHALIKELSRTYYIQSKAKGLHFELLLNENVPQLIHGDPVRMFQIIGNLLNNAIKFTTDGSIHFTVNCDPEQKKLLFSINDTGIGISPDKQKYIFEKFTQAEENITRIFGGSGLGLPIAKKLSELMNGDILIESTIGKGSQFTLILNEFEPQSIIKLPTHPALSTEEPKVLNSPPTTKKSVLSVDDNSLNQKIIGLILKSLGYEVDFAMSGQEALESIKNNSYEFILMDFHMPGLDGFETTRLIRSNENKSIATVPVIGISADVFENAKQSALSAGMDGIVHKPIKKEELIAITSQILKKTISIG